jgi:predicted HTH transcriptional regulator
MRNFEDHFVERKTAKDEKDRLKTVVAFANSAPFGYPSILFIGVKNSGEIERLRAATVKRTGFSHSRVSRSR